MADETPGKLSAESDFYAPIPSPVPGVPMVVVPASAGLEIDDTYTGYTPKNLIAGTGEAGVRTQWDASSLQSAIGWLDAHAYYLKSLSYRMAELKELMGGDAASGGKSPLGGFKMAQTLSAKHADLYNSTELAVTTLSQQIYDAKAALEKVKENYERAEERNALSMDTMRQVFAEVSKGVPVNTESPAGPQ
ncbi:hypothetical protein [Actinoplanes awajinensis]|uniref:Uncharacterized protein n=1 Tax=Actinoplanes awajinensis subsp. mycoplanecinus TaxID=135947 RepID=A0A101JLN5_9ACTN|nr:hypothetical protein [Actinoplanes awajinensis]KUL29174.1 hypothetical protein ADL15_28850 [Actinoplanes awajinensis subsp. mycoplanecinus]